MFTEWRKLLRQKKTIAVLFGLFVFQLFYFIYSARLDTENAKSGYGKIYEEELKEQQREYIAGFHTKIEELVRQADSLNTISIFAQPDSFSSRNMKKTKQDFQGMLDVQPVLFDGKYLVRFFSDSGVNGIAVICGIILAFAFIEEKKQGLRSMLFASVNGRGRLTAERLLALLLWEAVVVVFLYGGTLMASCIYYGGDLGGCLNAPIQSISLFANFQWKVGIGEFLVFYFAYRFLTLFLVTLAVWVLFFCVDALTLAAGVCGILGIVSYLLYRLIDSAHPLNFLRYSNPWYQISGIGFFAEYRNLNWFGYAVNKNVIIYAVWSGSLLLLLLLAFWAGTKKYPCTSSVVNRKLFLIKIGTAIRRRYRKMLEKLSLSGMEYYKILVSQKGIIFLLLILITFWNQADTTKVHLSGGQELYYDFIDRHMGPMDEAAKEEIADLQVMLADLEEEYLEAEDLHAKGELSEREYLTASMKYDAFEPERQFLSMIQDQSGYLEQLQEERSISGWYINQYSYTHLLNGGNDLWNIVMVLGIVLLCSGIFSNEKKCGMFALIRCCRKGRMELFREKMSAAMALSLFLFAVSAALEIGTVASVYGLDGLAAPVQSFQPLSFLSIKCSLGGFLVMLYVTKAAMLLVIAAFTCMFSARTSQKLTIVLSFTICIPAFLTLIGFEFFRYLSIIEVLSVAPFLLRIRSAAVMGIVSLVFIMIGIWSVRTCYKKWCIV